MLHVNTLEPVWMEYKNTRVRAWLDLQENIVKSVSVFYTVRTFLKFGFPS